MEQRRPVRAVVDPNVLVSAVISRGYPNAVLHAWHVGHFEMIVSYDLLYELEAVLMRPRFRSKLTYSDVVEYVLWLRERTTFVNVSPGVVPSTSISPDPDDEYLIELATFFEDTFLVSGDSHLLGLPASAVGARVVSPRRFLEELEGRG